MAPTLTPRSDSQGGSESWKTFVTIVFVFATIAILDCVTNHWLFGTTWNLLKFKVWKPIWTLIYSRLHKARLMRKPKPEQVELHNVPAAEVARTSQTDCTRNANVNENNHVLVDYSTGEEIDLSDLVYSPSGPPSSALYSPTQVRRGRSPRRRGRSDVSRPCSAAILSHVNSAALASNSNSASNPDQSSRQPAVRSASVAARHYNIGEPLAAGPAHPRRNSVDLTRSLDCEPFTKNGIYEFFLREKESFPPVRLTRDIVLPAAFDAVSAFVETKGGENFRPTFMAKTDARRHTQMEAKAKPLSDEVFLPQASGRLEWAEIHVDRVQAQLDDAQDAVAHSFDIDDSVADHARYTEARHQVAVQLMDAKLVAAAIKSEIKQVEDKKRRAQEEEERCVLHKKWEAYLKEIEARNKQVEDKKKRAQEEERRALHKKWEAYLKELEARNKLRKLEAREEAGLTS